MAAQSQVAIKITVAKALMYFLERAMFDINWTLGLGLVVALGTAVMMSLSLLRMKAEQQARQRLVPIRVRASDNAQYRR